MPDDGPHRATILTAIEIEYKAVRTHLTDLRWDKNGTVPYQRGTFTATNHVWDVLIRETGRGNVCAALETLLAIHYFHPALLIFIGVAGGLKEVNIGDVVIPTKVYAYESGRANVTSFQTRPQVITPTFPLVQLAQAEAKEQDWLQRLKGAIPDIPPKVCAVPVASGESVVASTRSAIYKFLKTNYSDAIAVEMESYGFLLAAHFYPEVDALVIRGISDLINNKKRTDKSNSQELAALHASAFAFELLSKVDVTDLQQKRGRIKVTVEPSLETGSEDDSSLKSAVFTESEAKLISTPRMPSQDFLQLMQQFRDEIKEVQKLFGERQTTFYDNYKNAIKLMTDLKMYIDNYFIEMKYQNRNTRFMIDKLNNYIDDIILILGDFSHIHSSEERRRGYTTLQKEIRPKFDLLVEKLRQLEELEQNIEES